MIVMKFGGTSVGTAEAMKQVAVIIQNDIRKKKIIVLSACSGITNKLLYLAQKSAYIDEKERISLIEDIIHFHSDIMYSLDIHSATLDTQFALIANDIYKFCEGISLLGECTSRSLDRLSSFGELLSTLIFSEYIKEIGLDAELVNASSFMKTDSTYTSAHIEYDSMIQQVQKTIIPKCEHKDIIITQGFIGSDANDIITTLGRGGSDFSAALIGMAVEAQEIVIWTDVSGIASADPKLIPDAHTIEKMSFQEARLLSFFGAKVLHPETILPAIKHNIPVIVKNTFSPHEKGTVIVSDSMYSASKIISITSKQAIGFVDFTHQTFSITQKMLFIGEFLDTLQCDIYAFGCLENNMYAVISLDRINFLSKAENLKDWEISYKEQSFIAAIGPNNVSNKHPDLLSIFNEIICRHNSMPILLSGISEYALCAVIDQKHLHQTMISLHSELIDQ